MDIKKRIDELSEAEAKAALTMNGGYIPLCPEMYKGDKGQMGVRPLPCIRDERGEIKEQTVKQLFAKINEELDELKRAVPSELWDNKIRECLGNPALIVNLLPIAAEGADVKTAVTTLEEALGIDVAIRNEAIRRVNAKNRERNRL